MEWAVGASDKIFLKRNKEMLQFYSSQVMCSVPYGKLRPISTPQLHALLRFHLVPINQIISLGT